MTEIERLNLTSINIVDEQQQKLKELFPEVFTEGNKVDFEKLKLTLGEIVDPGKERYGMNWPGKADCFKIIQQPSIAALKPAREESVDFDASENLFIEGDNLEVLKLLQKSYFGKVKMIYIDPPYNTGNDFIYPDDYSESLDTYLRYTGQIDDEGRKYSTNTEADGRFHSKWMNMMYSRLFLARNLLKEDGVIFISIDDNEVHNLKSICSEIFGEENFIGCIAWKKTSGDNKPSFAFIHDNILIYGKFTDELQRVELSVQQKQQYKNPDNDARGDWAETDYRSKWTKEERHNLYYGIKNPFTGEIIYPDTHSDSPRVWACSEETHFKNEAEKIVWWGLDGKSKEPKKKRFLKSHAGVNTRSVWLDAGTNDEASGELAKLFPEHPTIFDNPKPVKLIKTILNIVKEDEFIVMDFFAGSCTTAHACLDFSKIEDANTKFIMIQLPELTDEKSKAYKAGYKTIADIGKERIRRVIKKIKDEQEKKKDIFSDDKPQPDLGFKVFKLQPSNFKLWDGDVAKHQEAIKKQIELFVEHINPQSSQEDILYEILLKSGFPLTTKIERTVLAERDVFSIADGSMLICLDKDLTPEVIKEMAEMKPVRVVCLDEGFKGNDQLKTNAVQIMKTRNITFRTV